MQNTLSSEASGDACVVARDWGHAQAGGTALTTGNAVNGLSGFFKQLIQQLGPG